MSEVEKAENEAREWMREDAVRPPSSQYWAGVLSERDRLAKMLAEVEEQLAQRDERIAELERASPVAAWPEAVRLRDALGALSSERFEAMVAGMWYEAGREAEAALRAFLASAPPASAPSDALLSDMTEALKKTNDALAERPRQVAQLQGERDSALERARSWRAGMDKMAKDHEAEGTRWSREMGEKDAELREMRAALKSAPVRADDEYTRAAVAYAEAMLSDSITADAFNAVSGKWNALYNARRNTAPAAPQPAAKQAPDGERVTVYVVQYADGTCGVSHYSESERSIAQLGPGDRWLAIDASVVAEGGAS